MNKKKRIVTTIISIAMFCMVSVNAFAATDVHIYLLENQIWGSNKLVSRTGNYSYVSVKLISVFPSSGYDFYEKIQARLLSTTGTPISNGEVTLQEGKGYKPIYIAEGYLTVKKLYIQFRGNKNEAAEAFVSYTGN